MGFKNLIATQGQAASGSPAPSVNEKTAAATQNKINDSKNPDSKTGASTSATASKSSVSANNDLRDHTWIRQVMFIPQATPSLLHGARGAHILRNREFSPGMLNFADTTLGGNRSINPRPQFTEFADQNLDSLLTSVSYFSEVTKTNGAPLVTGGMGRYYAESIDSNAQRIFMDFGVPHFNSLTNFFANYYENDMSRVASQGILVSTVSFVFRVVGYITFWPIIATLKAMQYVSEVWNFLERTPAYSYYYMRPSMHYYWDMVSTINRFLIVNMGLRPGYDPSDYNYEKDYKAQLNKKRDAYASLSRLTEAEKLAYKNLLPDIFGKNGTINPRYVAARYQKLANYHAKKIREILEDIESSSPEEVYIKIKAYLESKDANIVAPPYDDKQINEFYQQQFAVEKELDKIIGDDAIVDKEGKLTEKYAAISNNLAPLPEGEEAANKDAEEANKEAEKNTDSKATDNMTVADAYHDATVRDPEEGNNTSIWKAFKLLGQQYEATVNDGLAWVSFIVDYEGGISESVSSSTKSSDIAEKMNSTSSDARNIRYNVADGQIADNAIFNTLKSMVSGAVDVVQNGLESIGLQGMGQISGNAFVDIPDFWENSDASVPDATYTIQLRSPYGNQMSLYQDIYFPLSMLIAAAFPRMTGRHSYTSPYMCRLWHKGRHQFHLAMITGLTINRATSNIGWSPRDIATGIDVTITIKNLSRRLMFPINDQTTIGDSVGLSLFHEENNMSNYMAVLTGLGLPEQFYHYPNLMNRHVMSKERWDQTFNVGYATSWFNFENGLGNVMNWFGREAQF